jgi:radical SAM-linked protein
VRGEAGYPVRLRYTKRGKIRWISHRDVARALERAFRVAELPLAFTAGFSPRPKVSFGLALSTGHESDAEYLDLELTHDVDLEVLPESLTAALPEGMAVRGAYRLTGRAPALQEIVTAVEWRVDLVDAHDAPVPASDARARVERALVAGELPTDRRRKGREVVEDVRPVIRRLEVIEPLDELDDGDGPAEQAATTTVVMELSTQPRSAKPDEVLAAIARATGAPGDLVAARSLRTHQWIERDGSRCEPHDADTRPRARVAHAS